MKLLIIVLLLSCGKKQDKKTNFSKQAISLESGCETLSLSRKKNIQFCIWNKKKNPKNLIFALHGIHGTPDYFYKNNDYILQSYNSKDIPTIISLSFGRVQLLTDTPKRNDHFSVKDFTETFMPFIISKLDAQESQKHIHGISMGGFNALQIVLRTQLFFESISLVSPALTEISPYSSPLEILKFQKQTRAKLKEMSLAFVTSRKFFEKKQWNKESPLKYLLTHPTSLQRTYLSTSRNDEFGFHKASLFLKSKRKEYFKDLVYYDDLINHNHINKKRVLDFHLKR